MEDLLGDADPEVSKKLTNETSELANLSNQIGTLTKQTTELKSKRATAEQELSTLSTQKQHIEFQLAGLRTAYEREAAQVARVEDQLAAAKAELSRLRADYTVVEQSYNELQSKKQEISSALESDKRENENLKQRMAAINMDNHNLRVEIEKLRPQARQIKGGVVIIKKQVSTGESERERLRGEIDDLRSGVAPPAAPGSPTPSQASANNNPFHRRVESSFSPSPFGTGNNAPTHTSTMEEVFGPSYSAPPSLAPVSTGFSQRSATEPSVGLSAPSASDGPAHSTPPTSPPMSPYHNSPHPSEAAPPSNVSNMASSFMPLPISRADSVTSSVQANPSASNQGEFSRPDTPTTWVGSSVGENPTKEGNSFAKPDDRRSSLGVRSDAGTESSAKAPFSGIDRSRKNDDRSPYSSGAPVERNTTGGDEQTQPGRYGDKWDSFGSTFGGTPSAPGAFQPPIKTNPTGESVKSNRSQTSNMSRSRFEPLHNAGVKEDRSREFEETFKILRTQERQHTGGSGMSQVRFEKEFPPIVEVGRDEDSDSDNERGFEDNFNPSPEQTHSQPATTAPPPTTSPAPTGPGSSLPPPPPYASGPRSMSTTEKSGGNNNVGFPALTQSPTVTGNSNADIFGQGSLFSSSPSSNKNAPSSAQNTGSMFPSQPSNASRSPAPAGNPPVPAKTSFSDQFEEEFGDLAPANEGDEKVDDVDFGTGSGFDGFDPMFDAPQSKGDIAPGTAITVDNDAFTGFSFNIDSPTGQPQQQQQQGVKTASSQDWEALFADMDTKESTAPPPPRTQTNGNMSEAVTGGDVRQQSGTGPDVETGGVALSSSGDDGGQLGEDAKVSKLTGMGFNRESSVKALEKHGYNLDQVCLFPLFIFGS